MTDLTCTLCRDIGWILDANSRKLGPPAMLELIRCPVPDCRASGRPIQSIAVGDARLTKTSRHPSEGWITSIHTPGWRDGPDEGIMEGMTHQRRDADELADLFAGRTVESVAPVYGEHGGDSNAARRLRFSFTVGDDVVVSLADGGGATYEAGDLWLEWERTRRDEPAALPTYVLVARPPATEVGIVLVAVRGRAVTSDSTVDVKAIIVADAMRLHEQGRLEGWA